MTKALQRGAITGPAYMLAPRNIIHSWVEGLVRWQVDQLGRVHPGQALSVCTAKRFAGVQGFCGYGAATPDLQTQVWIGAARILHSTRWRNRLWHFLTPDAFYAAHGTTSKVPKRWIYQNVVRHAMNPQRVGHQGRLAVISRYATALPLNYCHALLLVVDLCLLMPFKAAGCGTQHLHALFNPMAVQAAKSHHDHCVDTPGATQRWFTHQSVLADDADCGICHAGCSAVMPADLSITVASLDRSLNLRTSARGRLCPTRHLKSLSGTPWSDPGATGTPLRF